MLTIQDNFKKYRHIALAGMGIMIIALYAMVMLDYSHKAPVVSKAEDLPAEIIQKDSPLKGAKAEKVADLKKTESAKPKVIKVSANSYADLKRIFDRCDFNLKQVRAGEACVPRLVLTKLPQDMGKTHDMKDRKKTFIKSMLPMVLQTNEKIMKKRKKLLKIAAKSSVSEKEMLWLEKLATDYNMKSVDLNELKKRVDTVPPSLFLAQASMETGWGTSSAARSKKNLFGVTLKSGVKSYDSLQGSVDAYIHNLNYNHAYREMRDLRAKMRRQNTKLCSHKLIGKLLRYCERRGWYVTKIRNTIAKNNLKQFDKASLA